MLLCWFFPGVVRMRRDQIPELLAPFLGAPLSDARLGLISAYLDLLLRWNERINLTAVRRPEEIITRHFGESFFAARHLLQPDATGQVADFGSGAGFPGVPIALYAPAAKVTLIESNNKKATFLRELTRTLKAGNVSVFAKRAEDFYRQTRPVPDLVTLRAVEKFEAAVPVAASLLRGQPESGSSSSVVTNGDKAGRLGLLIGASQVQQAKTLVGGFRWEEALSIPQSANRVLLVGNLVKQESSG